jgi:glycosyltransferase involved in cell wall biosynthesis
MKILFDARWIRPNNPDGITRFSRELIAELAKTNKKMRLLISSKGQLKGLPKLDYIITNSPSNPKEILQARKINKYNFDVVYTPNYLFGGLGRKFKLIRTVHDLIPFNHKNNSSNLAWKMFYSQKMAFKKLINDSEELVTVSNTVKKELEKLTSKKISVVYNAPMNISAKNIGDSKNILYVGRFEPYKNVGLLVKAMDLLPDYQLILIGGHSKEQKLELLKGSKSKNRIKFIGSISDLEYKNYLVHAFCLATASQEEGFGLPIIEAMKVGCPVVCSDIPIFKEVSGDAALFFDKRSAQDLASKIMKLESGSTRRQFVERGTENAKKFSWTNSAYKLKSVLSDAYKDF